MMNVLWSMRAESVSHEMVLLFALVSLSSATKVKVKVER